MKIEIYSPTIRRKEMDAVLTAMVEEKIGPGDRNRLLIQTAKEQLRFDYALALRSPAVALHTSLKALCHQGQAVVLSALSPLYYLQVLHDLQLTPLFCDVTFDFPCMSRELIENALAKKPEGLEVGAVVLNHTLGFLPDTASIAELGLPVIEDVSQSYGSAILPKKERLQEGEEKKEAAEAQATVKLAGADSVFCIVGLEERDMLTSGGGAVLFAMNRKDGTALRNFAGLANEYCLPDINAALAVVQFKDIYRNIERRRDIAKVYLQASLRTRHKRFIPLNENEYCNYSFSLILETGLKDVIAYARKKEIEVENAFEKTIAGAGFCDDCPVSNSLVLRTVLFPMYPRLRSQDAERVSRLVMTLP
ncbi:MAG: DegT/DnrJ/EryC1/StrS family aminotransferase [Treponema sp.]|jgi:dTDP-4-amino-4,6-dideoxygalactose transaminase|nr:DegT/DnrJ/EryC1/StrS family aminotransferase [Treponema sp.]